MQNTPDYDGSTPLKGRRETFCQLLAANNKSAAEAARQAGYSIKGATVVSTRLLADVSVKARLDHLKAITAEKLNITREVQAAKCEQAQRLAWQNADLSNYLRSIELQSKHFALLTDVIRDERPQQALSDERRAELAEAARKAADAPKVIKLTG